MSAESDALHYGDSLQLLTRSSFAKEYSTALAGSNDVQVRPLEPVGFYAKNGRYGTLTAVPPVGAAGSPHFTPSTFTVLPHESDTQACNAFRAGEARAVTYGAVLVLVDDQGYVWNNRLGIAAAYIGPRPRGTAGEMAVSLANTSKRNGEQVLYGDALFIDVFDSHRTRTGFNKRLTNYKKSSSKLVGGYLVSDGSGVPISFTPKFISGRGTHATDDASSVANVSSTTPRKAPMSPSTSSTIVTPQRQATSPMSDPTGSGRRPQRQMSVSVNEDDVRLNTVVVNFADGGSDTLAAAWGVPVTLGEVGVEDSVTLNVTAGGKTIQHRLHCPPPKIDTEDDEPTDLTTIRSVVNLAKYGVDNLQLEVLWGSLGAPKTIRRMVKSSSMLSLSGSIRSRASMRNRSRRVKKDDKAEPLTHEEAAKATETAVMADYEKRFKFALFLFAITGICAGIQFRWTNSLVLAAATAVFGMLSAILIVFFAPFKKTVPANTSARASKGEVSVPTVNVESDEEEEVEEIRITRTLTVQLLLDRAPSKVASVAPSSFTSPVASKTPEQQDAAGAASEDEVFVTCQEGPTLATQNAASSPALKGSNVSLSSADIAAGKGEFPAMSDKWIRAEKGHRDRAEHRYKVTMKWRKEHNMDSILDEPQPYFHLIKKAYPHFMHFTDKDGHPLWYEAASKTNQKLLHAAGVTQDMLLRHYLFCTEFLWTRVFPDENGQSFTVLNMDGLTMASTQGETMAYVKKAAKTLGDHYPERSYKTFIINAPWWLNAIIKMVSLVLDPVTKKKISVYPPGSKGIEELSKYVDAQYIPKDIGGQGVPFGESPQEKMLREHVERVLAQHNMKPLGLDVTVD